MKKPVRRSVAGLSSRKPRTRPDRFIARALSRDEGFGRISLPDESTKTKQLLEQQLAEMRQFI